MMNPVEAWITQPAWQLPAALRAIYAALPNGVSVLVPSCGFILIGVLFYVFSGEKNGNKFSVRAALKYLFPANLYRRQSSKLDCWVLPLSIGLPLVVSAWGFAALLLTGRSVQAWLLRVLGASPVTIPNGRVAVALQFVVILLAADFAYYLYHYSFHKVPLLWRLHRAHHSAEVLSPLTKWRFHPLETLFGLGFEGPCSGVLAGTLMYLCGMQVSAPAAAFVAATKMAFQVTFYFRHSHIWISYGRVLNHIFYSPCMHHIHHSALPRHRDKNLGSMLAFWDFLFGTLYIPERREEFPLGISTEEFGSRNPHMNIAEFLIEPVKTAAQTLWGLRTIARRWAARPSVAVNSERGGTQSQL